MTTSTFKRKIIFIALLVFDLSAISIISFVIYLNYFWSLEDKDIGKIIIYDYINSEYQANRDLFSCVATISPDTKIKFIRYAPSGFLRNTEININNEVIIYPDESKYLKLIMKKYNTVEEDSDKYYYFDLRELLEQYEIKELEYSCFVGILSQVDPFRVITVDEQGITFLGRGSFQMSYGLLYYFNLTGVEEISRQYESGINGFLNLQQVDGNWYYFKKN